MKYSRRITVFMTLFISAILALFGCGENQASEKVPSEVSPTQDNFRQFPGKIVFQSDRDGDWEIFVINADGSDLTQITQNDVDDEYPVWSPDGTQIAFKSNRAGNYDLFIMNADGQRQRQITSDPGNDEAPAWSPDGMRLAFHSDRNGSMEVFLIDADGGNLSQLTDTLGKNGIPAWSPDGTRIAYTGNRYFGWNVYVMNLDRSDDRRLTEGHGACRPDWSPDGRQIAFVSKEGDGKAEIWLMNPDGGDKVRRTFDEKNYDYFPAWSPDGRYLAYAKTPDTKTGNWELYLMTADGTQHVRLTNHPARDEFPDWKYEKTYKNN